MKPLRAEVTADRFYTCKYLAELWVVKEQTVRVWLMQLKRAGLGPTKDQARLVQRNRALRVLLIRADYAVFMQRIKVLGMK